ncbi:glycoside hydrolase family 140 protein [Paenibacillus sp.]|uniref:glycoside hydrolase family 140 protein n=1 Tax=Paenibacillus sp. TaxID=58172 RepID=UPI002D52898F|nr:glycoside hydrolase family 140 protein [Paenibacillus sp.]HZG56689.1 glycoside hydrolase family 140 protein [Paenibacillus sp.]
MQRLQVSENGRFLVQADGTPFFWLGDTAWELFHKLDRAEAELYLDNRAERGFNVIQAVALAEFEGVTTGNAYDRLPLTRDAEGRWDPSNPDVGGEYDYWAHVDFVVDAAAARGMYIAVLPTWGDKYNRMWGKGPEIFEPGNAYAYGKWLGSRYRDRPNVVWVLGGDRPLHTSKHHAIIRSMALGLKEGDEGGHLIAFHPTGKEASSTYVHGEEWLDFNMIQSGHFAGNQQNADMIEKDYNRLPTKPILDAEPCYEDHPIDFQAANGYFDPADVRKAAYYAVFSGAFGHTYGHHSIWSMTTEPNEYFIMSWKDAVLRPGAAQMRHVRRLIEARPFLERVPDQGLLAGNDAGANRQVATRGAKYAMAYSPNGLRLRISMGRIQGARVRASWYDPRTGTFSTFGEYENRGVAEFVPPSSGRGDDWVLVLDGVD